jgi:hypothetical protein
MPLRQRTLSRRHVLRGLGACIALPALDAMTPAFAKPATTVSLPRFVAICGPLGYHAPFLFPENADSDFRQTPYMKQLEDHVDDLTLFSGLSHPENNTGHSSDMTWLTSAPRAGRPGFRNTISLDQVMAQRLRGQTRLPFLSLSGGKSLSWTEAGVEIPAERSPARVFQALFVSGTKEEVAQKLTELRRGKSILDTVSGDAKQLDRELGSTDRHKLQEYFSAIRDLEGELEQSQQWVQKPKPVVDAEPTIDVADKNDITARQRVMYDLIALALQTDSTRVVSYMHGPLNSPPSNIRGVQNDWHALSHHGRDETKIAELKLIEEAQLTEFNRFLGKLRGVKERDSSLLDNTAVLFGSNLGNASSHNCTNLPIIVAGGGYRHGSHIVRDERNNTPLSDLFVSLAQRMGVETDSFGSSRVAGINGFDHK